ncbi:MAG: helix-turn-helix transcriptional regulator [Marinisporobacter sp.]|nr:helix-turn-helix transcriptional regulator [Marinisporobacter sp.]
MEFAMNQISGKWKLVILWHIYDQEVIRFGELMKSINKITHKMLSNQLKELVNDGIIHKEIYKEIPPKVEYSLTEHGKTLIPIMEMLFEWGSKHRKS